MRAIHIYVGYIKVTTNDWDIRPLVAIKALFANISWTSFQQRKSDRRKYVNLISEFSVNNNKDYG